MINNSIEIHKAESRERAFSFHHVTIGASEAYMLFINIIYYFLRVQFLKIMKQSFL